MSMTSPLCEINATNKGFKKEFQTLQSSLKADHLTAARSKK